MKMDRGDIFGHIPRKKKDPPPPTSSVSQGLNNNVDLAPIPRKKLTINSNIIAAPNPKSSIISSSNPNMMTVPRKKKVVPYANVSNDKPFVPSSTSVGNASIKKHVNASTTQKLDRSIYHKQHQSSSNNPKPPTYTSVITDKHIHGQKKNSLDERKATDDMRLVSNERFRVISENPLVLKIKIHDIPMPSRNRNIRQVVATNISTSITDSKRKRSVYQELEDTDSDDFMSPAEEHELQNRRNRKRLQKKSKGQDQLAMDGSAINEKRAENVDADEVMKATPTEHNTIVTIDGSVPPGVLTSLWYSQERFLDLYVLDKVCGWKTRQKLTLYFENADSSNDLDNGTEPLDKLKSIVIDAAEASALQQKILLNAEFFADANARMEVSRINPTHCPVVMTLTELLKKTTECVKNVSILSNSARLQEQSLVAVNSSLQENDSNSKILKVRIESEREEVLLVKWRGRSYLHNSWERASDIQRLDPSPNFTARSKIRRFYQNQEIKLGPKWKDILEEERKTVSALHVHTGPEHTELVDAEPIDEYFSPQCLEIERILGCDENTMNMQVLAIQRAINIQNEQEIVKRKDEVTQDISDKSLGPVTTVSDPTNPYLSILQLVVDSEEYAWDPEDNVRYVVKWKELPYAEMTWEYWKDIKRDAVDEVEDFWYRQQAPDLDEASRLALKPHPHVRDFKKLLESRPYGVSKRPRPVADLNQGNQKESSFNDEEENDTDPGFRLRSYQLEGVNWLLFNWWNKRSCILADEMGLGKTIQSAAFLQELQSQSSVEVRGPFLIVAPLSLVGQWQSELASWAPDMNVILYHGSADAREYLVKEEFYYTEQFVPKANTAKLKRQHITKFHVLITTYEVVLKDIAVLSKIRWRALLVDEAHRLKNSSSKLFEELASVPRDFCVLLTGTPIANATEELWALLHFANPQAFADKDDFLVKFGEMTDAKQVNELHNLLKPYLLRRVKEDVEKSLPPKEETILEVTLTPTQKTFYKAIYERNTAFLFKGSKPNNAPSLMNVMMELRKCCNHPFLVKGAEERILNEAANKLKNNAEELGTPFHVDYVKLFSEQLVKSSGKMVLMEKLLEKLFTDGHKVLVFSQMVRVLDLLEELLKIKKYRYERLDGSTSSSSRVHAVERFKRKSLQRFVMLLSTRAGGLGLNLTAASVVIIFDSDWNPQNDLQAMARAHRIGQTKAVRVYRFLTAKTYEMHMFHSASLKLGLERAVLSQNRERADDGDGDESKSKRKSDKEAQAKEIDELLKKGAYDVFRDDDDKEGEKFMETDIDQLLEQSSKKITYGASSTTSLGNGLGSFSKASFVANTEDGAKDVDLDDPDFWSKAIGLEAPVETPEDIAAMLDDGVKRSRKQVQVYDPYAETAEAEQRKKDKIAIEKQLEKDEKDLLLLERQKKRKKENKKKRTLEKAEMDTEGPKDLFKNADRQDKDRDKNSNNDVVMKDAVQDARKIIDNKPKKQTKKYDRMRALKRAENEDPVIEKIKQAWEAPHRNRATAAAIRFGFGRFCKLRSESNLSSLPLQDLESFVSSYVYQLSLQFSVTLLSKLQHDGNLDSVQSLIQEWLGSNCRREVEWICDSVQSVMKFHADVESFRRFLRMPVILAEPTYTSDLRRGAAFRALRRIGMLNRLNCIVEEELDTILLGLGHEELGKRGCGANELSSLDADLKSRYVTTEELSLVISSNLYKLHATPPASWWDRSCDVGLIVGTFVHGLGNYEAMRNDLTLPFAERIRKSSQHYLNCKLAMQKFRTTAGAARRAFDDALESARVKAELEVQAAVAAAAKAASKREEDAALLRKGGAEAEFAAKNMPETQVENAFEFDGTDSHFVTLSRIYEFMQEALWKEASGNIAIEVSHESSKIEDEMESQDDGAMSSGRMKEHHILPMPDARVLDYRVVRVLEAMEAVVYGDELAVSLPLPEQWEMSSDVRDNIEVLRNIQSAFLKESIDVLGEYIGVGLGGSQCGTSHRSLNDGSDFSFGSASNQLSQVAYGTDAPRFLRAIGVPMNITRFAITGLAFSDSSCVTHLLSHERLRWYGNDYQDRSLKPAKVKSENEDDATDSSLPLIKQEPVTNSISPIDPITLIPHVFIDNARLRASICMAVLYYGFPRQVEDRASIDSELWKSIRHESNSDDIHLPPKLFDGSTFREVVCSFIPDSNVPDINALTHYIESFLLPQCLRLCVNGNGPATRNARGSHGEYETAFGVSIHPEPSLQHPSPIPDPCLTLQEHSLEAVGLANALLRRVRLLRTCQLLCLGSTISTESIIELTHSTLMGQLSDMPVWWCPWIHDIALLLEAASKGLFSIIPNRNNHMIFSPQSIQNNLNLSVISDVVTTLPAIKHTSQEQIELFSQKQANKFPSLNQLERRLAILCSEATIDVKNDTRYHNLPMFDHGGWPRN